MLKVVTAELMQKLDRRAIEDCGIPGIVLMENAGRGAKEVIEKYYSGITKGKVGIFAGKGNNGGDGFVIARHLSIKGAQVKVYLLTLEENLRGDAKIHFDSIKKMGIDVFEAVNTESLNIIRNEIGDCNVIVDAIFGTGLTSELQGIFCEVIDILNTTNVPKVAVDIPSGLDANTGKILGTCLKADLTVTFAYPKLGLLIHPGLEYVGKLEIIDISIPPYLIEEEGVHNYLIDREELGALLKPRNLNSHKGDFGHLLIVAGSAGKTGAAALTCQGAMRVGAGLVTLTVPGSLHSIMESKLTEVMTEPVMESSPGFLGANAFEKIMALAEDKDVLALGPGISTQEETIEIVHRIIKEIDIPLVIDADGLNAIARDIRVLKETAAPIILTPHPGEMARLVNSTSAEVQENRTEISREFAEKYNVHLVLKGLRTLIADPEGNVYVNPTGNPGMASAGMGDVLTGMIAGFVAQGFGLSEAARLAVFSHGLTGDIVASERGERGLIATDVLERIPEVLKGLTNPAM